MRSKAGVFAATFRLNAKEERAMRAETMHLLEILELADLRDETASNLPYGKQRPPGDRPRARDRAEPASARRARGRA